MQKQLANYPFQCKKNSIFWYFATVSRLLEGTVYTDKWASQYANSKVSGLT